MKTEEATQSSPADFSRPERRTIPAIRLWILAAVLLAATAAWQFHVLGRTLYEIYTPAPGVKPDHSRVRHIAISLMAKGGFVAILALVAVVRAACCLQRRKRLADPDTKKPPTPAGGGF